MGLSVLERCGDGLLCLRMEAEGYDSVVCGHRYERGPIHGICAAYVIDLHRVNCGRLVAGSTGVLMP